MFLYFRNFLKEASSGVDAHDFGNILSACTKRGDIVYVILDPKWKKLQVLFTNEVLKDVTKIISNDEFQNVCDEVGISTKGYNALYQLLKDKFSHVVIQRAFFLPPKNYYLQKEHAMMS